MKETVNRAVYSVFATNCKCPCRRAAAAPAGTVRSEYGMNPILAGQRSALIEIECERWRLAGGGSPKVWRRRVCQPPASPGTLASESRRLDRGWGPSWGAAKPGTIAAVSRRFDGGTPEPSSVARGAPGFPVDGAGWPPLYLWPERSRAFSVDLTAARPSRLHVAREVARGSKRGASFLKSASNPCFAQTPVPLSMRKTILPASWRAASTASFYPISSKARSARTCSAMPADGTGGHSLQAPREYLPRRPVPALGQDQKPGRIRRSAGCRIILSGALAVMSATEPTLPGRLRKIGRRHNLPPCRQGALALRGLGLPPKAGALPSIFMASSNARNDSPLFCIDSPAAHLQRRQGHPDLKGTNLPKKAVGVPPG